MSETKLSKSPCSSCFFYESEWDQSNQEDDGADQFSGLCDFHDKWVDFDETCEKHEEKNRENTHCE